MSRQIYAVCLKCLFSLVLLLSVGLPALGQSSSSAAVNGIVQDTTDARIPNASVKLINTDTGTESNSTTNKDGSFTVPSVLPGHYRLQIERDGFDTTQLTGITLNVGDNKQVIIRMKVGSSQQTVNVDGSGPQLNTTDASVSTVIDRKFVENIPLNGRSFQDLISMTPGVVTQTPQNNNQGAGFNGEFSVNGQRAESNYYIVDGVSGNTSPGSGNGYSGSATGGTIGSSTALGTTQSLLSVDALQEFRVESSTYSAEFGRSPGGQFSMVSRSGTNGFHGSAFDYLRNNFFDANDWFNDLYGKPATALRQNDFGGTLGGPVWLPKLYNGKDRTFFFASYEALRLTLPTAANIQYVPDTFMRQQAVPSMQGILNAFPIQNGIDYGTSANPSLAQFIEPYSSPSDVNSTSIRADHSPSPKLVLFFRYGNTSSSTSSRPSILREQVSSDIQTYTLGATSQLSSKLSNAFRLGYDRSNALQTSTSDGFGGAVPINLPQALGMGAFSRPNPTVFLYFPAIGYAELQGGPTENIARQWNLVDSFSFSVGDHQLKGGLDYRHIKSPLRPYDAAAFTEFLSAKSIINGSPDFALAENAFSSTPVFNETALFIQDEWRVHPRFSLSLGLRWEVNPPPTEQHGDNAYTLLGSISNPSSLSLAPQGTPLYRTTWMNFAPRLGGAWVAHSAEAHETVIRAGGGVFFDTANEVAAGGYSAFGFSTSRVIPGVVLPFTPSELTVPFSVTPPYTSASIYAFPSHLQLPYTLEWNTSIQQAFGKTQALTISYVAANGRRQLEKQFVSLTQFNPEFGYVNYFPSGVTSNYQALQLQFQRSVVQGIHALASYTWSHSIDFGSTSSAYPATRGNSDFDVRNNFQGGLSWDLPAASENKMIRLVLDNWGVDSRLNVRSSFPITLQGNLITNSLGMEYYSGLNVVPGQPPYVYGSQYPGGRAVNKAAFSVPATGSAGDAPRNFVRGFGATQLNLAARRQFPLRDALAIQFRAEAFNILNHPNFGYVDPSYTDATFGKATEMLNESLGTMASQYQQGGPRSMQFSLRLSF